MVAGSILPVAWYKNKLYFLFGKENSMEDSAKGFSDFGGRMDEGEKPYDAALREGGEELTGFLGDASEIRKLITKNGGYYPITHNTYNVHIFRIEYDENLPRYYNQNHAFLWDKMDKTILNDSKLFEKIEIGWFTIEQMKARRSEFRGFYQEIVDHFLEDMKKIRAFIVSRKMGAANNRKKTVKRSRK